MGRTSGATTAARRANVRTRDALATSTTPASRSLLLWGALAGAIALLAAMAAALLRKAGAADGQAGTP